ncbi:MAG: hypothetical protein M1834_000168 [Cirrosporium novae-zelandiae]|nr:MAG: hypothetical protein M1834_000168 [Cirrosporium novae-zelandiae]
MKSGRPWGIRADGTKDATQFRLHTNHLKLHSTSGPIHTSFNDYWLPVEENFVKAAYKTTGTKNTLTDARSGDHLGFYSSLGTVDRIENPGTRSYAATGFLKPNLGRPNLKILTEALATKVFLDGNTEKGVEFTYKGNMYQVWATQEVILSAGVIQTPQLLELSGIGNPEILSNAGVECVVENKSVGTNFQNHVLTGMVYNLVDSIESLDAFQNPEYAAVQQQIYDSTHKGPYGSPTLCIGFLSYASLVTPEELDATIAEIKRNSQAKTSFEKAQEKIIVDQLRDPKFANLQAFCVPCNVDITAGADQVKFFSPPPQGKNRLSLGIALEHPLSHGTVHISSKDPTKPPVIL